MEGLGSIGGVILYCVFLFGLMYLIAFRPQKKEKKKHEELFLPAQKYSKKAARSDGGGSNQISYQSVSGDGKGD